MAGSSKETTNHEESRRGTEERCAVPQEPKPQEISWDVFLRTLDEKRLRFPCQDKMPDGKESRFHKSVNRE